MRNGSGSGSMFNNQWVFFFGSARRKPVVAIKPAGHLIDMDHVGAYSDRRTTGVRRSRGISNMAWKWRGLFRLLMVRTTK